MTVYPWKGALHVTSQRYGSFVSDDKTIIIDDGSIDLTKLEIDFSLNNIVPQDKVFVSKQSSFPSLLLSRIEGIDIARTISIDKATKVVIDNVGEAKIYNKNSNAWYCEFISSDPENEKYRCVFYDKNQCNVQSLTSLYRLSGVNVDTYSTSICLPCIIVNLPYEYVTTVLHYPSKLVETDKLIDYTNNFLPKLDNDTLMSFSSMLSGGDKESVKLAVNLLSNYNISDHIIPVAGMLRVNYNKIIEAKCATLSAFERVCNVCGINKNDLRNSTILDFNSRLYESVNTDNDRMLLRDIVIDHIKNEIKSQYQKYISQMGLSVCID